MAQSIKGKIGLGLITCNALHKLQQSAPTVPAALLDCFVIVNDGAAYPDDAYPAAAHIIQHDKNYSVGKAKNDALRYLMDQGCEHLFLMEDDVLIEDPQVFQAYIQTAQQTGVLHLNYALQGPQNFKTTSTANSTAGLASRYFDESTAVPNPHTLIDYENGQSLALYPACVGAFSYFHRTVIEKAGYFDETFINAWEHVEHTYRIILAGFHPPFWHFADLVQSDRYLKNIPHAMELSTIAKSQAWQENSRKGETYFKSLYGSIPAKLPQTKAAALCRSLTKILTTHTITAFPDKRKALAIRKIEKQEPYWLASLKRKIAYPLALRRLKKTLQTQKNESGLFFFFPFYHVGGAERVHIDILASVADRKPWTFFTNESDNDSFLQQFKQQSITFDIGYARKKQFEAELLPLIAAHINAHPKAKVVGCNSHFFYKLIPFLAPHVCCIDLIHAFSDKGIAAAEDWSLPLAERLQHRVFISKKAIADLQAQYHENGLSVELLQRVSYIPNQTFIPAELPVKADAAALKVVYVGRASAEKRVPLMAAIAQACSTAQLPITFTFIGAIQEHLAEAYHPYIHFAGEVHDAKRLQSYYREADVLLMASTREGFPMVMMEAMAHGAIPVSTAVGDIPNHIQQLQNGLLTSSTEEAIIQEELLAHLKLLLDDPALRKKMAAAAYAYAHTHFGEEGFRTAYRKLLL